MKNKKYNLNNLKFLFSLIIPIFFFLSCNPDNIQPNGSVLIKWNMTLDGQNYSWQGNYPESSTSASGGSQYVLQSGGPGQLILSNSGTGQGISVSISHSSMTGLGTSIFSQSSSTNNSFNIMSGPNILNSNQFGGSLTLNITNFPSNTVQQNGISNSAIVEGNFSGTIGKLNGTLSPISGSFESIRIQ